MKLEKVEENYWKIVEKKRRERREDGEKGEKKMEKGRKNEFKGEREEKGRRGEEKGENGRLGNPKRRRPAARYRRRRWNACHVPSTFARKATMFERPRKKLQI